MTSPFAGIADRVKTAAARGATEGIEAVRAAAIPLTPLGETGNLRGQTVISPVTLNQTGLSTTLAFTMIYARYQHEGYGFRFTTPGTGAGYLSKAADQTSPMVKQIIANHIKGALR